MHAIKMINAALLSVAFAAGALTAPAPKPRPAPALSFLKQNSYSLDAVINQIRNDRQLLLRYANHFHISPEAVLPYFRENLVESYVAETKRYPVWMKRADGSTFWRYQTFRKGERVLALKNGEPVLKWACGNPLLTELPKIEKRKVVRRTKQVAPTVQNRARYYTVETPFEAPETPQPPETPAPQLLAALPADFVAPASRMTEVITRQPLPRVINPLPAVAVLPFILENPPKTPDIPQIPEPGTVALALIGTSGVGLYALRRRA